MWMNGEVRRDEVLLSAVAAQPKRRWHVGSCPIQHFLRMYLKYRMTV